MDYFIRIKAALDWIEGRLTEDISPAAVASQACFSRSHFHTVFRAAIGMPLAAYIRKRRLCHAAQDLLGSTCTIMDIALRYGFGSHEAFIRAFRREFRCSPSAFRAAGTAIEGGVIVPGFFGPMPPRREQSMKKEKGIEKGPGFAVLNGVPEVSYLSPAVEVTPFPSSLRACFSYLDHDVPYAHLLTASGAAFRLAWNTTMWDGGNVDILGFREDPTEPLRRACQAAGCAMDLLCKEGGDHGLRGRAKAAPDVRSGGKGDFIALIKEEIDAGRALIGFGIIGPPEACVIAGYREDGETLLGWNFFQAMPEFASSIEKSDEGYFIRRGWFEHPETIAVMAARRDAAAAAVGRREIVRDTLALAVEVISPGRVRERACGLAAFDAWAAVLGREEEFPEGAPLHQLMERQMCMTDALTEVGEGRYYAWKWCEYVAAEFPAAAQELGAAAEAFKTEHDLVWKMSALLGGMGMGETQARNLAKKDVRQKCRTLIAKAGEMDGAAAGHLSKARVLI
jgi:AraC-like DNA-binding protein